MTGSEIEASRATADAAEELWQRETHALVRRMFRARVLLVPMLLLVVLAFLLFDPTPWKLALISVGIVLVIVMFAVEQRRLRHTRANERTVYLNLMFAVGIQSLLVYVTGGIASPMLAVYVPLAALAGLSLTQRWRLAGVVGLPMIVVIALALGAWTDVLPAMVPAFFRAEDPLSQGNAWLFTRAGVILVVIAIAVVAGATVRGAFERVVRGAIRLRQSALDTLESRNREILSTGVTIAHELKNPLSSIQGLTQLMARRAEPGTKERERVDVILREIHRMTTVLDEFRGFTRPLSGLTCSPVSLAELAASVVALHEGSAARRGVLLVADGQGETVAECDAQKVKQALVNLVQNALEASPRDAEVRVSVLSESTEAVVLRVRDQGPGIDEGLRHKLFTPGFTTKERGTGIGLVVARSVIEQHGGKLELRTHASGGAEATITLPRKAPETTEVQL